MYRILLRRGGILTLVYTNTLFQGAVSEDVVRRIFLEGPSHGGGVPSPPLYHLPRRWNISGAGAGAGAGAYL